MVLGRQLFFLISASVIGMLLGLILSNIVVKSVAESLQLSSLLIASFTALGVVVISHYLKKA